MSAQVRAIASLMRRPVWASSSKNSRQVRGSALRKRWSSGSLSALRLGCVRCGLGEMRRRPAAVVAAADVGDQACFQVAGFGEGGRGALAWSAVAVAERDDVAASAAVDARGRGLLESRAHQPFLLSGLVTVALPPGEIEPA